MKNYEVLAQIERGLVLAVMMNGLIGLLPRFRSILVGIV